MSVFLHPWEPKPREGVPKLNFLLTPGGWVIARRKPLKLYAHDSSFIVHCNWSSWHFIVNVCYMCVSSLFWETKAIKQSLEANFLSSPSRPEEYFA